MRTASSLTYLKGVLIRQLLRITTTARREHSRSSTACHSCFSTEGRAPGRPQPTRTQSVVTWLRGTNQGSVPSACPPGREGSGSECWPSLPCSPSIPFPSLGLQTEFPKHTQMLAGGQETYKCPWRWQRSEHHVQLLYTFWRRTENISGRKRRVQQLQNVQTFTNPSIK